MDGLRLSIKGLFILFACALSVPRASAAASSGTLAIEVDEMEPVTLPHPASAIFIANPSVADFVLHEGTHLVLHGRFPGTTHLLAYGEGGEIVSKIRIIVGAGNGPYVTLFRGTARNSLVCAPRCSPGLVPGDERTVFGTAAGEAASRAKLARGQSLRTGSGAEGEKFE